LVKQKEIAVILRKQLDFLQGIVMKLCKIVTSTKISDLERHISFLKSSLISNRLPRFAIIGRRGAGKSSLINALLNKHSQKINSVLAQTGKATWVTCGGIELLDTRGCQDSGKTLEEDEAADALDSVKLELAKTEKFPDAIAFVVKAKDVDSAIKADIKFVEDVVEIVHRIRGDNYPKCPLIAIVSQIDELDPPHFMDWNAIFNPTSLIGDKSAAAIARRKKVALKKTNIDTALDTIRVQGNFKEVIPVCSIFDDDIDNRYNIDYLRDLLQQGLPNEAQFQYSIATNVVRVKKAFASRIVDTFVTLSMAIAAAPGLPAQDIFMLTPLQISMVIAISYLATPTAEDVNFSNTDRTVKDFFVAVIGIAGTALLGREVARSLIKFIPGWGYYSSIAMAASGTLALGRAAIAFFIDRLDNDVIKQTYHDNLNKKN